MFRMSPVSRPPSSRYLFAQRRKELSVVFWIHGGGWQVGDKREVQHKPEAFVTRNYVFVSTNYRLLPHVEMESIVSDVAKSVGWVHKHIQQYGGAPDRILIMGHSAGAQLAALLCTDESYLAKEGVSLQSIRCCVPVDGDTYDIPAIITTAETRRQVHGLPQAKYGHREKFGNSPNKHANFSAVNHINLTRTFLLFHSICERSSDTSAQAMRLASVLNDAKSRRSLSVPRTPITPNSMTILHSRRSQYHCTFSIPRGYQSAISNLQSIRLRSHDRVATLMSFER